MLASWVLPGWMSDTQEQLKEKLGMAVVVVVFFCFCVLFFLSVLFWHSKKRLVGGGGGSVCMFRQGGGVGSESAKKRAWKSVYAFGRGKQATHRNGILLKLL